MIVAYVREPRTVAALEAATLPEEDLFVGRAVGMDALHRGFPRLLVLGSGEERPFLSAGGSDLPVLTLTAERRSTWPPPTSVAVGSGGDLEARLRAAVRATAPSRTWVDELFRGMGAIAGRPLPAPFRGFCRRVLEFPAHYADLHPVADLTGFTRGALKARFRRRGLRSPAEHLRWLRVLAVGHVLSQPGMTTGEAAYRLGFTSSGNLCRAVQATSGISAGDLRSPSGRGHLLIRFSHRFLAGSEVAEWSRFAELFLRTGAAA